MKKTLLQLACILLLSAKSLANNPPVRWLPGMSDKDFHFLANSHGVPLMGITMYQKGFTQVESIAVPVIVMSVVSVGKELSDLQRGGVFNTQDLIADLKGIITGAFITLVVNGLIQHVRDNREVERQYKFYNPVKF